FPIAALGVLVALWLARRRLGRGALAGILFFAVTLAPALGFVSYFWMQFSYVADHFQYTASVGVIALAAAGATYVVARLGWPQSVIRIAAATVLALLALGTWVQSEAYKDVETFYRAALAKNPDAWMPHNNLGQLLEYQGRLDEALQHFSESLR